MSLITRIERSILYSVIFLFLITLAVPKPAEARERGSSVSGGPAASASSVDRRCNGPLSAVARSRSDLHGNLVFGVGARTYRLNIISYLQKCGGYVRARHQIYIDTRTLPHGQKLTLVVSTKRSDGKWARAHTAPGYVFSATQRKHDEVILYQDRGVGVGLSITEVNVRHCLCAIGDGNFPVSSTVKASYRPYYGQELSPGQ